MPPVLLACPHMRPGDLAPAPCYACAAWVDVDGTLLTAEQTKARFPVYSHLIDGGEIQLEQIRASRSRTSQARAVAQRADVTIGLLGRLSVIGLQVIGLTICLGILVAIMVAFL